MKVFLKLDSMATLSCFAYEKDSSHQHGMEVI
ncbi:hypothetical protein LINPERHAP1_LOCUS35953 [Linum perenne]